MLSDEQQKELHDKLVELPHSADPGKILDDITSIVDPTPPDKLTAPLPFPDAEQDNLPIITEVFDPEEQEQQAALPKGSMDLVPTDNGVELHLLCGEQAAVVLVCWEALPKVISDLDALLQSRTEHKDSSHG